MIPSMTMTALENLRKALADGDFSEGWRHECTNHPMVLEGTTGFEIKACPEYKDFIASLYLGSTRKGAVMKMDVAIERIDTGYEEQNLTDADPHVRLVSFRVPTWSWAWGGISVLVGDGTAGRGRDRGRGLRMCSGEDDPRQVVRIRWRK